MPCNRWRRRDASICTSADARRPVTGVRRHVRTPAKCDRRGEQWPDDAEHMAIAIIQLSVVVLPRCDGQHPRLHDARRHLRAAKRYAAAGEPVREIASRRWLRQQVASGWFRKGAYPPSHVPRHWHSANGTHTVVSGTFVLQYGDGRAMNWVQARSITSPAGWCIKPGPSRMRAPCSSSPLTASGTSIGGTGRRWRANSCLAWC